MSLFPAVHPTITQNLPQAWLGARNKLAKNCSTASPAYNRIWSGPSYFPSFISLPNKIYSHWPRQTGLLKLHKLHGTIIVTPGPQCSLFPPRGQLLPSLLLLHGTKRRRKYTTALNTSTRQREPLPGRRSKVHLRIPKVAPPTPFHPPCLDSRHCK